MQKQTPQDLLLLCRAQPISFSQVLHQNTCVWYLCFCPCRAHLRRSTNPGRCPGLCACWAFSPLLERLLTIWVGKGDQMRKGKSISSKCSLSSSVQGTPRRGNEHIAQGIALGGLTAANAPCKGKSVRTHAFCIYAFALAGRICGGQQIQGDALGYALAGPSARSLNAWNP